jgi:hypothetical protein
MDFLKIAFIQDLRRETKMVFKRLGVPTAIGSFDGILVLTTKEHHESGFSILYCKSSQKLTIYLRNHQYRMG